MDTNDLKTIVQVLDLKNRDITLTTNIFKTLAPVISGLSKAPEGITKISKPEGYDKNIYQLSTLGTDIKNNGITIKLNSAGNAILVKAGTLNKGNDLVCNPDTNGGILEINPYTYEIINKIRLEQTTFSIDLLESLVLRPDSIKVIILPVVFLNKITLPPSLELKFISDAYKEHRYDGDILTNPQGNPLSLVFLGKQFKGVIHKDNYELRLKLTGELL